MDTEAQEHQHICFLALTRPVMYLGVTFEALMVNGLACGLMLIMSHGLQSLLIAVGVAFAVHMICRAILWHDHNRFNLIRSWFETAGRQRNRRYWGGSSVSPLRLGMTHTLKDFEDV